MVSSLELFKAGDKAGAIDLLKKYNPEDDTTDIVQTGADKFLIKSKKNIKGAEVELPGLIEAGTSVEKQYEQMRTDKRFFAGLARQEAKDEQAAQARLKQAKTVTQGQRESVFAELSPNFQRMEKWAGMDKGKQVSLTEDVARRMNEIYVEGLNRGEEIPVQRAKDLALGEITSRIRPARKGKLDAASNAIYYTSVAEVIKDVQKRNPSLLTEAEGVSILKYGFKPEDLDAAVKQGLITEVAADNLKKQVWGK